MPTEDLLLALSDPLSDALARVGAALGWSAGLVEVAVDFGRLVGLAVLVGVLTASGGAARRTLERGGYAAIALRALALAVALGLYAWILRHPSPHLYRLVGRWDQTALAAALGLGLVAAPAAWRQAVLALVGLPFLVHHGGVTPLAVVVGGSTLGWLLLVAPVGRSVWATVAGQSAALGSVLAVAAWWRQTDWIAATHVQGLFAFVLLRHVSMVVDVRRGRRVSFLDFACFMFFYPGYIGSSELYGEFQDANLRGESRYDYGLAARRLLLGAVCVWVAKRIPDVSLEQILAAGGAATAWGLSFVMYLRGVFFVMGLWAVIEGLGLLYGIRLRPNFPATVLSRNPAEFWRSWRATMTNWLIQYVYIPLGGNRRHQLLNVAAAFAVSAAWHCLGLAFAAPTVTALDYAPIIAWGAIDALGVMAYVLWRRHGRPVLPPGVPTPLRSATKIALTSCFALFTVVLLGFAPGMGHRLGHLLRLLIGLGG